MNEESTSLTPPHLKAALEAAQGVRFLFITGGVVSSIGKGLHAAALAALLQARGYRVRLRKLDPYLNLDPGTMNPYQHGEVFVTEDGAETDLDLGHYERFTGGVARRSDSVTAGQIYQRVLARERRGDYLGGTVQVIPHITDAIKEAILDDHGGVDFLVCEIGGTVGDIESLPFFEAIRQLTHELGRGLCAFIHVTLVPYIKAAGEAKTKPTQHSVRALQSLGVQPDILLCRSETPLKVQERTKIASFCNVRESSVIQSLDVETIYALPRVLHREGLDRELLTHLSLPEGEIDLQRWDKVTQALATATRVVDIIIVGKYMGLLDAYKSLIEALTHGAIACHARVNLRWFDAQRLEQEDTSDLRHADGILVPGGFGTRGFEGKVAAAGFARVQSCPYLGICLGMHAAVVDFARHCADLPQAGSHEFGICADPVVAHMGQWKEGAGWAQRGRGDDMGGSLRLGGYPCALQESTRAAQAYGTKTITERHRHRYEVNPDYCAHLENHGLVISGLALDNRQPEIIELKDHPWFIGVQFHPELRSRPFAAHPLFSGFIAAALERRALCCAEEGSPIPEKAP